MLRWAVAHVRLLLRRVSASARTLPDARGWGWTLAALAGTAAVSLPFGIATGFLNTSNPVTDPSVVLTGCVLSLVSPALLEEALFRSALLPHPAVDPPPALRPAAFARRAALPLASFVLYHYLNPRAESRAVFFDPRFTLLAAVLGVACSATHYATRGSLAAVAVVHWVPVCVWLMRLGGFHKLGYDTAADAARPEL